jgi:hypothetical protein
MYAEKTIVYKRIMSFEIFVLAPKYNEWTLLRMDGKFSLEYLKDVVVEVFVYFQCDYFTANYEKGRTFKGIAGA